jgi:hypothetical protein
MKTLIVSFVIVAALAPVAAFAAAPSANAATSAKSDCAALKAKMGGSAFVQAYGTFGGCVSKYAPVEQQVIASANATCSAQQADANFASTHGGKTFDQYYGTGKKGSNAFGNCVSATAKASSHAEQTGRLNPAQTCRAERTQMGSAAFGALYGKNGNAKNAFGKCVSAVAKAQVSNELSASASCRAQQSDSSFAASHGGQTFEQVYGTFGGCVAGAAKQASTKQEQATVSASKQCYAELKSDPKGFKAKYRTFGSCVSQLAKQ